LQKADRRDNLRSQFNHFTESRTRLSMNTLARNLGDFKKTSKPLSLQKNAELKPVCSPSEVMTDSRLRFSAALAISLLIFSGVLIGGFFALS